MTPERMTAIFDEAVKYQMKLEPDAARLGPQYLQESIAQCRNYLNHVSLLLSELRRSFLVLQQRLNALEAAYSIAHDELLATDSRVTQRPNIADREAAIAVLLAGERREIEGLKNEERQLLHTEKMVKHVHSELRDVMSEIKTQRAIVRDDLDTGAFYGDERNQTRREVKERSRPSSLAPDDMDESEIDKILNGEGTEEAPTEVIEVQAEADTIPSPEPVPTPHPVEINTAKTREKTEEEHIQAFYEQKPTASIGNSTTSSGDDFSDVFENL